VTELEKIVAQLSSPSESMLDKIPEAPKTRRGAKPTHGDTLFSDRDQLVLMLEQYWPELEPLCIPHPKESGLRIVLFAVRDQMGHRYRLPARHLLQNLPELIKFLSGNRFRADPRQIANALAGVPGISTWRSLKVCQASPCTLPIGDRARRAYIQRRHLELHGRLMADYTLTNFASALRMYRRKSARLNEITAMSLYQTWPQCEPDYQSLRARLP